MRSACFCVCESSLEPNTVLLSLQVVARDEDVSDRDKLRYFLSGDGVFNPYDEVATRHSHPRPDNRNRGRTTKLMARQKPGDARGSVGGDRTELEVREAGEASNEVNLAKDTDGRTTFDTHRKTSVDNNKGAGGWEYPNKSERGSVIQEDSPVPGNNMSTEFNDHRNYTESNEQSRKIKASRSRNKPGKHRNTANNRRFSGSKTTENKNGIAVPGNHFVINERTGRVQLIKPLDRDAPNGRARWALTVSVSDGAHTSTADLFVNVKDINDNAPFFPTPQLVASVRENSPAGTAVAQVSAVDHDDPNEGDHATLHYTLEKNVIDQQSGHPIFVIEPSTGLGVPYNRLRDKEAHGQRRGRKQTCWQWSKECCGSRQLARCHSKQSLDVQAETISLRFGQMAGMSSGFSTMTRDLPPSFGTARRTVAASAQSLLACSRRLWAEAATVRRAVPKLGGKSLVIVEKPLLMPAICPKRLKRCQRLMNDLKSAPPDINPLDCTFWQHIEVKACRVRHPNITALEAFVDCESMTMNTDSVVKTCKTFRKCLEAIIAVDGGTGSVLVQVEDENDVAPSFSSPDWRVNVPESAAPNTTVALLTVLDPDTSNNLVFRIVPNSGPGWDLFYLTRTDGSSSGALAPITYLDFEDSSQREGFNFKVEVTDEGPSWEGRRASSSVSVRLLDSNDHSPHLHTEHLALSITEDLPVGTLLAFVNATDGDQGLNGKLNYKIVSDSNNGQYFEVSASGCLTLKKQLDREMADHHELLVLVSDHGTPALTATATVTVTVADVNDNPPILVQPAEMWLWENSEAKDLGGITLDDADDWKLDHGPPFDVALDPEAPPYILNSFRLKQLPISKADGGRSSAVLSSTGPLDREAHGPRLLVPIIVTDVGGVAQTATVTV
ncbi:Cadherin, partial [Trinorchestia longiramus]